MMRTIEQPLVELPTSPFGEADPASEALALETGHLTFPLPGTTVREMLEAVRYCAEPRR
jgi:hypothetical protein